MRFGIIGTGRIADRFVKTALAGCGEQSCENEKEPYVCESAKIVCVYNPHIDSARRFAEEHNIDTYTDNFEKFLAMVDAVYIASPHETHYEYAKAVLLAGRNVLCEKPIALKKSEAEELYKIAAQNSVVLMEAVKTAYCPGFQALIQMAQSGKIGRIADVEAAFTRLTPFYTREYMAPVYNGSMLEFGSYVLLPIIKLMGTDYKNVDFKSIRSLNGVDAYTKVLLDYDNGMAAGKTGLGVKSEGQLLISGTSGYILAESPWWLTKKFEVRYEDSSKREVYTYPYESSGLQYEMKEFLQRVAKNRIENVDKRAEKTDKPAREKVSVKSGLAPEESIAMAGIMERFLEWNVPKMTAIREKLTENSTIGGVNKANNRYSCAKEKTGSKDNLTSLKIWAHRGCSYLYPENTIMAFRAAAELQGITGIELDVQMTKDGEIVVFHDENVKRVTDGEGNVADYTLQELKQLKICEGTFEAADKSIADENIAGEKCSNRYMAEIPTLAEVLELLKPYCESKGLLINIELKTGVVRYEGIEEKTIKMVRNYGLSDYIVYSSFLQESVQLVKELDKDAKTGMLAYWGGECAESAKKTGADALHIAAGGLGFALPCDMAGKPIRVWNLEEPFWGEKKPFAESNLEKYKIFGATDIITNVPERYLQ